jgi:hypothetical protein
VTDLLDGTDSAPAKTLEVEHASKVKKTVSNPDYYALVAHDQDVLSYLINSLSPDILAHVIGLETTKGVWSVITKMFSHAIHVQGQSSSWRSQQYKKRFSHRCSVLRQDEGV